MSLKSILGDTKPKKSFLIRSVECEVIVPTIKEAQKWEEIFKTEESSNQWVLENVFIKDTGKPAFDNVEEIEEILTADELGEIFTALFEKKTVV